MASEGMHLSGSLAFSLLDPKGLSWTVLPLTVLRYCRGYSKGLSWDPHFSTSIYINDPPDGVVNSRPTVRLFADDCIIYLPIRSKRDTKLFQSDFDSVGSWEKTWLMQFNADKCFTMRAGVAGQQFPRPVLPPGVGAHACHPWLRQCLLPVLYWADCSPHVD